MLLISKSPRRFWLLLALVGCTAGGAEGEISRRQLALAQTSLPNSFPVKNANGFAATFSTAGRVDLTGPFFTPQGTNGRHCGSCHKLEDGWSISAQTLQTIFDQTGGLDPVFNLLDADRPNAFPSNDALRSASVEARRAAFTMLLQGKFTRRINLSATAQFEVIDVQDPFGVSTPTTFWFFRRAMPTANLRSFRVNWDNGNGSGTDVIAGLKNQARGNILGAQQGVAPVNETIVQEIVDYEKALSHAQLIIGDDLRLDEGGAKGGPANLSKQKLVAGPFTLFDAWAGHNNALKAQIARGQSLFNNAKPGRAACSGCHSAANDGQSATSGLFNIGSSRCDFARPDMARFTLRNKVTGETRCTTDGGRGFRSGLWDDLDRFDTPSLRGVGSRGGYLHNGIARTLMEVVQHYERALNFGFTQSEREDLVAFLKAL
jgi:hypothetical protein